ncbi:MAG: chemotaxis protein CheA [bacterium]
MATKSNRISAELIDAFFEEAREGLETLESGLLGLADDPDGERIHPIFRAAHSIKGAAGAFGFGEVTNFTHHVETLLDLYRAGQRAATQSEVDLLLRCVDGLRGMLDAARHGTATDTALIADLETELKAALASCPERDAPAAAPVAPSADDASTPGATRRFDIVFRPHRHLLRTGNEPARILRELESLGELSAECDTSALPSLVELAPEDCYLAWNLRLVGAVEESAIREAFAWVDDDCDLAITEIGAAEVVRDDAEQATAVANAASATAVPATSGASPAPSAALTPDKVGRASGAVAVSSEASSIRVSIEKVDALINMVGELVITQSMLGEIDHDFDLSRLEALRQGLAQLARNTRELQDSVMRIRMLPIGSTFNRFTRLVRDLGRQLGKQIEMRTSGENTELDKTVLEKIADPLVHLIRNSIDHGVEPPEQRRAAGKPEVGVVHLNAFHQGSSVVIEVRDDGAGLDRARILESARKKGFIGGDGDVPDEQIFDLIFLPGLSTAKEVSDVSGRGVGMDVVRRNIQDLGGTVSVRSEAGVGTTFAIRLPLTLAILDGQLVRVGQETYIIPLVSIVESLQIQGALLNSIAGRAEVYRLRNEIIPVLRLHELFGLAGGHRSLSGQLTVVVENDGQKLGLVVDELLGQQQVVIKSLETNFRRLEGVSGATILGNGVVALILDIAGLVQISRHRATTSGYEPEARGEMAAAA